MNFVSLQFWALFLGGIAVYSLLRCIWGSKVEKWDAAFLLLLSLLLFASESLLSFQIFVGVGFWILFLLRTERHLRGRARTWFLVLGIAVSFLPLVFYKYWRTDGTIPVGLSFYTFQLVGLLSDGLRTRAPIPRLRDYWNFAAFFPQIVAGPIERRASLMPQLREFRLRWDSDAVGAGLRWVVLGFFYKLVLADNLASAGPWVVESTDSAWVVHLGNLVFGMRIYFDFCGYSLIALGLGAALGVRLTMNFQAPYWQTNIQKFWQTWHVSLSYWFRDYVYIPLGGNKSRFPALLVLLVFAVSGVWHGAGLNFVLWGLVHGVFLVVYRVAGPRLRLPAWIGWQVTLFAAMTSWLFFYQTDIRVLCDKLGTLASPMSYLHSPLPALIQAAGSLGGGAYVVAAVLAGAVALGLEGWGKFQSKDPYVWSRPRWVQVLLVVLTCLLAPVEDNGFVYFNF